MKIITSLCLAIIFTIPSVCFSMSIDGYQDIKFNMSLEEVKKIVNADKYGISAQDMWSIFRLTRFEASIGCLLDDNKYEQKRIIDVYNAVREADGKLFDVEVLSYADKKMNQQVQVYFYKNKVMYIVIPTDQDYDETIKILTEKYGNAIKCGQKFKDNYFITAQGGIRVSRYAVEYFNIPLCKDHADAMKNIVEGLKEKGGLKKSL